MLKIRSGNEENKSSHRQPNDSIINSAKIDSKAAPIAQKDSIKTTHFARWALGKNSAYNVTLKVNKSYCDKFYDWGTPPMPMPKTLINKKEFNTSHSAEKQKNMKIRW